MLLLLGPKPLEGVGFVAPSSICSVVYGFFMHRWGGLVLCVTAAGFVCVTAVFYFYVLLKNRFSG